MPRYLAEADLVVPRADGLNLLLLLEHEALELIEVGVLLPRAVDVEEDGPELFELLVLARGRGQRQRARDRGMGREDESLRMRTRGS